MIPESKQNDSVNQNELIPESEWNGSGPIQVELFQESKWNDSGIMIHESKWIDS